MVGTSIYTKSLIPFQAANLMLDLAYYQYQRTDLIPRINHALARKEDLVDTK